MNRIDEEEEEDEDVHDIEIMTADQFPSVRPPPEYSNRESSNKNICSSKQASVQTDRTKYQTINRSTSLPSRQSSSSNINIEDNVKQRRRYASDSNNNNNSLTTTIVTSFLQHLRSELRATTNDKTNDYERIKTKKSSEDISYLSEKFNNFSHQQYPINMSSGSSSQSIDIIPKQLSNENLLKTNDDNEISTLINLLILRVECLANKHILINKKKNHKSYPTIKQIDQNLTEYLYYLFNKFTKDDPDICTSMIDKTNFVNVCQTLVRNGCFNMPSTTSPDQSFSESTLTNSNDPTLTQTFVREYKPHSDDITSEKPSVNEPTPSADQETWLVVDLEPTKPQYSATVPDASKCLLPISTFNDQLLLTNENYFSFEEIKSCGSESSHSNYYSPDSSLVDIQNMVQEFDEINNNNNNNNNNALFNEDGSSSSIDHASNNTNVIIEGKDNTSNNDICTGLTNDSSSSSSSSNEQVVSSSMETNEQMTTNLNGKKFRRERKMQERWTITTKNDNQNNGQSSTKPLLGVEFPPIAVLRRKFSSLPPLPPILNPLPMKRKDSSAIKALLNKDEINNPSQDNIDKPNNLISSTTLNPSMPIENQEINTSTSTAIVDKPKADHVDDLQSNDISSLIHHYDSKDNDEIRQPSITLSELLTDEKSIHEDMTTDIKEEIISSSIDYQNESITNLNNDIDQDQPMNINTDSSITISDLCASNSSSSGLLSTSSSSSSSSPSSTTNTNETKTNEVLLKEQEHYHVDNVDEKDNINVEHNYHASGILLTNDKSTQRVLLEEEKKEEEQEKERPSSLLPLLEQCNQQQPQDDSPVEILSNNVDNMAKVNVNENDNEQRYKTIEIEEISDDEETLLTQINQLIEPTDCILTDDEPRKPRQSNITTNNDGPLKFDSVLSCYEKVLSKVVEKIDDLTKSSNELSKESQIPSPPTTKERNQRAEDDPIALRALQRFEQRMNAAKTSNEEISPVLAKSKSSWSGTPSTPRKSLENVFKTNQQVRSASVSNGEESTTTTSPRHRDTFIRPRKTMLDDIGLNFGMTMNLFGTNPNNSVNNDSHKSEEQQQPIAIAEYDDKRVIPDESTKISDSEDSQQQKLSKLLNLSMASETGSGNEMENSNSLAAPSSDSALNTIISQSSSEQQSVSPYSLHLEGRRRLNTLERIRERRQSHDSNNSTSPLEQKQQHLQNEYTIKPEELQDPIIRRALERFDEKSRSLAQAKPMNYDEIQDPITRRALMRLETNLKRTIPSNPTLTNHDSNETWYRNNYPIGSLHSNNDNHLTSYPNSTLPPPSHTSLHQRFCSTSSSDMPELFTNNIISTTEHDVPTIRVPTYPVYSQSNNQQQLISFRQRSRSEDMLSSRDLSVGQITTLDNNNDLSQLQRNHSSHQLPQQQETPSLPTNEVTSNETGIPLPNTIIKSLDPNFIRTQEAVVNYATPTQTYSAYSCEYTRPHRNQSLEPTRSELSSRNFHQPLQQENVIQYSTPSSSAFTPVHPSTNNYYPQQPLPTPSYSSLYTSNNLNQTPYSDDPIVRRALERFNCQMQNSLMQTSQHQPNMNYIPRQFSTEFPRQGNHESFYPADPPQYDPWTNVNRGMPLTANTSTGYQSIIGRRRQIRHDDVYHDNTNIGNGYSSSSLFANSQNPYPMINSYVNYTDEPPVIPPRLNRDLYHEQQEYPSDNANNNNNNNNNTYTHYGYPPISNGFRAASHQYIPSDSFHQLQEDDYLRHRAQSTSSTTSSDSVHPIRLLQQRLPETSPRTNIPQNKKTSPDNSQIPSGRTTPSNGSTTGDSVFNRLAYAPTKSSLSKSSSNLCANLLNKNPPQQQQQTKSNTLKAHEIDYDDSINIENNQESISTPTTNSGKCQRSRSVDGRARLKNAQNRVNNANRSTNDGDESNSTTVPSSKFTSINPRRDAQPPRIPSAPRPMISDRTSSTKRVPSGTNLAHTRNGNGTRTRVVNGNVHDTENDENIAIHDNYQPKIIDNKTRISIPVHRYATNHIQTSASTSSVTGTMSRTKAPLPTSANLYRRDLNASGTDLNRSSKRSDDHRLLSPTGQRRNIPVSVFAPAKLDNKRPAPVPPSSVSPTDDSTATYNCESQQDQTSHLSRSSTGDSSYTTINNENEINKKLSTTNSTLKTSKENILNELSYPHDKHDTNKKMNVFERLFRGHKKKV